MSYNPDAWVILKFSGSEVKNGPIYKVLAGWYGGYGGGDSWKMNSGITSVTKEGDVYAIAGYSGSVYNCHQNVERMTGLMSQIYSSLVEQAKDRDIKIEIVHIEDILDLFRAKE